MRFRDRVDAGKQLAAALHRYRGKDGVVYALPRGGVALGAEIAKALGIPLDMIGVRKIGHPLSPEYAICAVAESGTMVCNEQEVAQVDQQWFKETVERERAEAKQRHMRYTGETQPRPIAGKTAIIVDDGIATGLTMEVAIRDVKQRAPARTVVAVPVCPDDTATKLLRQVDELVALDISKFYLGAVGAYYDHFEQVSDDTVIELLKAAKDRGEP